MANREDKEGLRSITGFEQSVSCRVAIENQYLLSLSVSYLLSARVLSNGFAGDLKRENLKWDRVST